jgi:hypothetical protein
MIMIGHSRRLAQPLRWDRRERLAVAALLAAVVAALVSLGVYALTSGSRARADCISVTFPSTLGGAQLQGCGARARSICASGAFPGLADALRAECTRAGFAFRRPESARPPT